MEYIINHIIQCSGRKLKILIIISKVDKGLESSTSFCNFWTGYFYLIQQKSHFLFYYIIYLNCKKYFLLYSLSEGYCRNILFFPSGYGFT